MAYHTENATNSAIEKKIVEIRYDMPRPICNTSAAMVLQRFERFDGALPHPHA